MKPESPRSPPHSPRRRRPTRLPAFYPVPLLRGRHDGWSPERQAEFLGRLAETGAVAAAARAVGMSRESAYRLRRRPGAESFAAVWDLALGCSETRVPKVTDADLHYLAFAGRIRPVLHRGRYVGMAQKPDGSALLRLLARLDRLQSGRNGAGPW